MKLRTCRSTRLVSAAILFAWPALANSAGPPNLELVQTIELTGGGAGKFDHLAINAKQSHLYIADKSNNSLDVVDLKAGKMLKMITDQKKISGVAYAPDLNMLAVGNGGSGTPNANDGTCKVYAAPSYKIIYSRKFPDADNVKYCPKNNKFYVEHAEKKLSVFDPKTGEVAASIDLPGDPEGFVIDSAGARLYICTLDPDHITVIDVATSKVLTKYPLNFAKKIVAVDLDEANQRLFVGCRDKPMVVVMDAASGKEVASVEIPGEVDDVFYDAKRKRIYAICGEGAVAVIEQKDKDHYEAIEKVVTAKSARTGYFDPETGRLYVAVPKQDAAGPQVRVYQAKP
jgi:DNA-binding beta-propeller fold protein YncE